MIQFDLRIFFKDGLVQASSTRQWKSFGLWELDLVNSAGKSFLGIGLHYLSGKHMISYFVTIFFDATAGGFLEILAMEIN